MTMYGAIEAGGTKMVCAVGDETGKIIESTVIPTETPALTMPQIIEWFKKFDIKALGLACFGPIDLHEESETYGYITSTPKLEWENFNILGCLKEALNVPVGFDTDVNGAILGEMVYGSAKGLTDAVYITIGTGIGGGVFSNGKLLHGMLHPEIGHMFIPRHPKDDFTGLCPYHGSCFEGLASGPSIESRWGAPGAELSDREEVWDLEAYYIAEAITAVTMVLSPQRFILGGGVMKQEQLFPMIRRYVGQMIAGYLRTKELEDLNSFIVPSSLQGNQGILGALKLAIDATE